MRRRLKNIIFKLIILLNLLVVLSLLIAYLSVYIPPDKWWFPSVFGLAYPILLLMNAGFVLFWLFFKPRYIVMSLVSILIGWGFITRYFQLTGRDTETADIKVMSYNVKHFNENGLDFQKQTADEIIDFLEQQDADIICLQEVRLRKKSIFNLAKTVQDLKLIHHYQYARSSTTYGSVTMTRYPIVYMGEIRFENSRNISIYTDIVVDEDTVRVINVHLQSYQIDPSRYSIIESQDMIDDQELEEVREMGNKFKNAYKLRTEQVREISRYIDESPHPVILCGDFNDPPASYTYNRFRENLKDAFVHSGKGIGRTYVGKLPSLRIDYILHSDGFQSYNFETYDFRKSDHLPISCVLKKK